MTLPTTIESIIVSTESIRPEFGDPGLIRTATNEQTVSRIVADPPNFGNEEPQMTIKYLQISDELLDHPTVEALSDRDYRILIKILRKFCYSECKKDDHGEEIILKRGQLMYTKRHLADHFKMPTTSLENLIRKLAKVGIWGHKVGHVKSILTLSEKYIIKNPGPTFGPSLGQDWATKEYKYINNTKAIAAEKTKPKRAKPPTQKVDPKPAPTPAELELKEKRRITIEAAIKHAFPLSPAEINAQIKKYSLEAVRFVITAFVKGEFKDVQPEWLKKSLYTRIKLQHELMEDFHDPKNDPNAA